jgi:toxin ParE1/3/4
MKLVFSKAAVSDLVRLREFIAVHNPAAAQRVATRLRAAISRLTDSPQIGRPVGELPGETRELIFGKYVVRYQVRQAAVYILRVWHGREDR